MLKNLKPKMLLTSMITILPILLGLLLWNKLPEQVVTHWDANGVPNGWSSKLFAVVGLPLFILACHIVCIVATMADPKAKNHSEKILTLVLWICPVTSLFCMISVYAEALGYHVSITKIASVFVGLLFIAIGNYLPKCKQNYTVGIKVPWTLNSIENWNRTHRFAGKLWILAGITFIVLCFIKKMYLATAIMLLMATAPMVYSFWYYKKYEAN